MRNCSSSKLSVLNTAIHDRQFEQNTSNPFNSIEMKGKEYSDGFRGTVDLIETYISSGVKDLLGISFLEFKNLPRHEIKDMVESLIQTQEKLNAIAKVEKERIEREGNESK